MKTKLKNILDNNRFAKIIEICLLFLIAFVFISFFFNKIDESNIILKQVVLWFANIIMLLYIWLGIKVRGQKIKYFGITFGKITIKQATRNVLMSLVVFAGAMLAFILGSIIMANITGIPEGSDMSGYDFLKDNIGMLVLTLVGVYIVSSFGEEVIYRAFLINRFMELGLISKTGKIIAVILSAIIFGLAHYQWGPMGIVQTGFMGAALGFFYLKFKKKIWILVLAHAYMDTILMVQMYLASN